MSLPLATFYPQIAPRCKRASQPQFDQGIIRAAREVAVRTKLSRESIALNVLAGVQFYIVTPANLANEEVVFFQAAQYNPPGGQPYQLTPMQPEQLLDPAVAQTNNCIQGFWTEPPSQIALWPRPVTSVAAGLSVRAVKQPTLTAVTIDNALAQFADRAIAEGALAWILEMPNEPWTDLQTAMLHRRAMEDEIHRALHLASSSFQQTNMAAAVYKY